MKVEYVLVDGRRTPLAQVEELEDVDQHGTSWSGMQQPNSGSTIQCTAGHMVKRSKVLVQVTVGCCIPPHLADTIVMT